MELEMARLIVHSFTGELSNEERERLDAWLTSSSSNRLLYVRLREGGFRYNRNGFTRQLDKREAWCRVNRAIRPSFRLQLWLKLVAASVVVFLLVSVYFYLKPDVNSVSSLQVLRDSIVPGARQAELILSDGLSLKLDSTLNRSVVTDSGTRVRIEEGRLTYDQVDTVLPLVYHTLKIPRGGKYVVRLDDGSMVYLNSSSTLRYPSRFAPGERRVYLSGEAYFEVSCDPARPFHVEVGQLDIRVYGTSFNVTTRKRDRIQALLVSGKIGLTLPDGKEVQLSPSQLADYDESINRLTLKQVNLRSHVAWRDGWSVFEGEPLEEVLNELSLWYDVDIVYLARGVREQLVYGEMKHCDDIRAILEALSKNVKVHFKIDGKNVIVYD